MTGPGRVAQLVGVHPMHQKVVGSTPVWAHKRGKQLMSVCLSLSLSSLPSLKSINISLGED